MYAVNVEGATIVDKVLPQGSNWKRTVANQGLQLQFKSDWILNKLRKKRTRNDPVLFIEFCY